MTDRNPLPGKKQRMGAPELEFILKTARVMMNRGPEKRATLTEDRRFRELFGCGPLVALKVWSMLLEESNEMTGADVVHMLWAMMFLKVYAKETTLSTMAGGVDEKTFRKWSWQFVSAISSLETTVVSRSRL